MKFTVLLKCFEMNSHVCSGEYFTQSNAKCKLDYSAVCESKMGKNRGIYPYFFCVLVVPTEQGRSSLVNTVGWTLPTNFMVLIE